VERHDAAYDAFKAVLLHHDVAAPLPDLHEPETLQNADGFLALTSGAI